jgi:hypothetical protein
MRAGGSGLISLAKLTDHALGDARSEDMVRMNYDLSVDERQEVRRLPLFFFFFFSFMCITYVCDCFEVASEDAKKCKTVSLLKVSLALMLSRIKNTHLPASCQHSS